MSASLDNEHTFSPAVMLGNNRAASNNNGADPTQNKLRANKHKIVYKVTNKVHVRCAWSLIDRGLNGYIGGDNVRVIHIDVLLCRDNVTRIASPTLLGIPITTVGDVIETQWGPVIAIWNQVAVYGKEKSI